MSEKPSPGIAEAQVVKGTNPVFEVWNGLSNEARLFIEEITIPAVALGIIAGIPYAVKFIDHAIQAVKGLP